MVQFIDTLEELEQHYGTPAPTSLEKVTDYLTPEYAAWIERSRFCVLTTVGPEGTDGSPRGDDGPVATQLDARTLALPDWRGNNRIDSLRNVIRDGRVSLMFMVPGSTNVVRVNGTARLTADEELLARFEHKGKLPRTALVVRIGEVYFQCARAIVRSGLWKEGDQSQGLPTAGQFIAAVKDGFDGEAYDADWPGRAQKSLW